MTVMLVGDFTHWERRPISMKRDAGGIWAASVALEPGTHHYRFMVDGEWADDPECTIRVPKAFGSQDNVSKVAF